MNDMVKTEKSKYIEITFRELIEKLEFISYAMTIDGVPIHNCEGIRGGRKWEESPDTKVLVLPKDFRSDINKLQNKERNMLKWLEDKIEKE